MKMFSTSESTIFACRKSIQLQNLNDIENVLKLFLLLNFYHKKQHAFGLIFQKNFSQNFIHLKEVFPLIKFLV